MKKIFLKLSTVVVCTLFLKSAYASASAEIEAISVEEKMPLFSLDKDKNLTDISVPLSMSKWVQEYRQYINKQKILRRIKCVKKDHPANPKGNIKVIVALLDGKKVGRLVLTHKAPPYDPFFAGDSYAGNKAVISDLEVKPEFQKHGIGDLLLRQGLLYIKKENKFEPVEIRLLANPIADNTSVKQSANDLVKFYQKRGAHIVRPFVLLGLESGYIMKFPAEHK